MSKSRFSWKRPLTSYGKVQHLVSALIRNRRFQLGRIAKEKEYLNIGCGPNVELNFVNLDYFWHPAIDLCWDITRGLPFGGGTFNGIYSEHCFEHLSLEAVHLILGECFRVLKPGRQIRIIVPDGEMYLNAYVNAMKGAEPGFPFLANDGYRGLYSPIMSVNRCFRRDGHLFIFDFATIKLLLEKNGFVGIEKTAFRVGREADLLIDYQERECESLYVEASKPAADLADAGPQ